MTADIVILAHKQLKKQHGLKKTRIGTVRPDNYDPYRALLAGVALQAVRDAIWPTQNLSLAERQDAIEFLAAEAPLYLALGIPVTKLQNLWDDSNEGADYEGVNGC